MCLSRKEMGHFPMQLFTTLIGASTRQKSRRYSLNKYRTSYERSRKGGLVTQCVSFKQRLRIQEMTQSYEEHAAAIDKRVGALFKVIPTTMTPYSQLVKSASAEGSLSSKVKELMAFSISITIRCEDCIVFHLRGLWRSCFGCSRRVVLKDLRKAPRVMHANF